MTTATYACILPGQSRTGAHRDSGTLVHAVALPRSPEDEMGCVGGKAACGAEPGRRSSGWTLAAGGAVVTCPKCLAK